ncbi:MAG: FtsX-like permease family protein [Oscillospiraceae bacterium]|nr:FtsX-like permease family protein [Oscillospiraceae bacterium]
MKISSALPLRNLRGNPVRTAILIFLTAILSLMIFGGTLMITSLKTGLHSLESRLGADIMVVPYEAATKSNLETIVLQGATGYFYMDEAKYQKIASTEGIGQISAQFFLASASSGCCSLSVQIIGFDPDTDFTITPWIKKSYGQTLQKYDIIVGNDLNAFVGDTLIFYGVECRVAAKLDKTGTSFDTAVFTNQETIKALIQSSLDKNMNEFKNINPDKVVSCVLINAAEGYTVEDVLNDINLHVKKVKAVRTKDMISGISDSLAGVSDIISILIIVVWIAGMLILLLAFAMSISQRKKEFAVLRVIGASQNQLAGIVMQEALLLCLAGSLMGAVLGLLILLPFQQVIEEFLNLPFLLPSAVQIAGYVLAAVILTILTGCIAVSVSAFRISRIDTALILRGDT